MIDDGTSRRRFLATAATAVATAGLAGCTGSTGQIHPQEPSEPREGSPEEFYYFLEDNDVAVEELAREDDELFLTYDSEAETIEESDEEIMVIYEVYKLALIHRGSEIEYLYSEIEDPFEEQALGWGIDSEWVHRFDDEESEGNETDANGSTNSSVGNESDEEGLDMDQVTLWSNIMNTKVYEDDVEAVGNESDANETAANASDASNDVLENESD
ncbi:twin-arginine translocation signal domain-containing protein [Natronococcus sp.]|uniref:twin-arginine translocation signal domain-containing protein n=1 Tax=Natronococcus sp. TaxID=35747 RepID=UPI0025D1F192|nr:twin-arginine translocation signal domain-containing protein [Natronococcus sp.]